MRYVVIMRGYEDRREQYSRTITAAQWRFHHQRLSRPQITTFISHYPAPTRWRKSPHGLPVTWNTYTHLCCMHTLRHLHCRCANQLMCSCVLPPQKKKKKSHLFCLRVFCTAGDVPQHLSFSFKAAFPARGNLWGRPGCFKVCLFDKLWIKCRVGCSKRRSYLRSWLWHCCVWKTEDATRGKNQTKGGFASNRGNTMECCKLTVHLIYRGERG